MQQTFVIDINWSAEDNLFIAEVRDLPGCIAHGHDRSEAEQKIKEAIQLRMDTAKEFGDPLPRTM